jgi:hypothetical protein
VIRLAKAKAKAKVKARVVPIVLMGVKLVAVIKCVSTQETDLNVCLSQGQTVHRILIAFQLTAILLMESVGKWVFVVTLQIAVRERFASMGIV